MLLLIFVKNHSFESPFVSVRSHTRRFVSYQIPRIAFHVWVKHVNIWATSKTLNWIILLAVFFIRWFDQLRIRRHRFYFTKDDFSKEHFSAVHYLEAVVRVAVACILSKVNSFSPHTFATIPHVETFLTVDDNLRISLWSTMPRKVPFWFSFKLFLE